jgi:hypothetical protein
MAETTREAVRKLELEVVSFTRCHFSSVLDFELIQIFYGN